MNEYLAKIPHADDIEINEIINAITRRYSEVYPDWEIMFLALPRNDPDGCLQKLNKSRILSAGFAGNETRPSRRMTSQALCDSLIDGPPQGTACVRQSMVSSPG